MWVYFVDDDGDHWWVGYWDPGRGEWVPLRRFDTPDAARREIHYLNGGNI
jgi:hypothetical protein